ncbi:MAG TPA: MFS transporter [Gaiellaceae bacterium]
MPSSATTAGQRRRTDARAVVSHGFSPVLAVWGAWLVLMCGANLATPLYAVYRERFGFSNLVLTTVFAAYAIVLIPSLLVFGQLSDRFGRRRVMAGGLGISTAGLALFAFAGSAAWLYGARALQGVSVGMISGAATAALVELDPDGDSRRAAFLAALAQAGGSGLGPIVGGVLAEWAPAPRQLCYLALLAVTLVAIAIVLRVPEPATDEGGRWRITRPSVPREIRSQFARVGVTAGLLWASAALYLSVVPSYAGKLLDTENLALLGAIAALVLLVSCLAQVVARRGALTGRGQPIGLAFLGASVVALVLAAPTASLALLLTGAALAGIGHGLGFVDAQDELNRIAPDERRGEVTAAFITCIYTAVASSTIAVGLLDQVVSLSVAVAIVAIALGAAGLAAAVWHLRSRAGRS